MGTESHVELEIVQAENLAWLRSVPDASFQLVYVDPPFNTGKRRELARLRTERDEAGDRTGFGGRRYRTEVLSRESYEDRYDDYLGFLRPRLEEAVRVLDATGSLFVHLDPRESHYVKVCLDGILGRERFVNEIVWAYDYGARSKRRWPAKHDVILWYVRDPGSYTYRYDDIDRVPYMAPGLVGAEKAKRGKTPTDVWWQTIVSPTGRERTGYPTQKPLKILERIVRVHSNPGERVLDFFAGSGTTGEAAVRNGRHCVLVDRSPEAVAVMKERLAFARPCVVVR
ncbi:MAG: site-specific DNA-methyltransferase [Planctomycetota bacterium]|nr:site-specific DNA-methyltransferase [Planctomycetota bacterium]